MNHSGTWSLYFKEKLCFKSDCFPLHADSLPRGANCYWSCWPLLNGQWWNPWGPQFYGMQQQNFFHVFLYLLSYWIFSKAIIWLGIRLGLQQKGNSKQRVTLKLQWQFQKGWILFMCIRLSNDNWLWYAPESQNIESRKEGKMNTGAYPLPNNIL